MRISLKIPIRHTRFVHFCSIFVVGDDRCLIPARAARSRTRIPVRTWAIRLLTDPLPIDTVYSKRGGLDVELAPDLLDEFAALGGKDPSGLVRMALASTLQRLPASQRAPLAQALLSRSEESGDHNIPPLVWTGLIAVADVDPDALVQLAADCRIPYVIPPDAPTAAR